MNVTIKDMGLEKILQELRDLDGKEITIGLHEDLGVHPGEHNTDRLTYAQIGSIQEFGATVRFLDGHDIEIPSRPFTATSFDLNQNAIISGITKVLTSSNGGYLNALLKVGEKHAEYQKRIMDGWKQPPNSARTIKYKGKNDPLDWSGAMIRGVKAKIGR